MVLCRLIFLCLSANLSLRAEAGLYYGVYEGQDISIRCPDIVRAEWYINGVAATDSENITENTLHLHNVSEKDNGVYYCKGNYSGGSSGRHKAYLLVGVKGEQLDQNDTIVYLNKHFYLGCHQLYSKLGNKLWFHSYDYVLPKNSSYFSKRNIIGAKKAKYYHEGHYSCYAYNQKVKKHFWSSTIIHVFDQHRISYPTEQLHPGESVTISCNSSSPPKWLYRDINFVPQIFPDVRVTSNVVIIKPVTEEHRGFYECVGKDSSGNYIRAFASIQVLYEKENRVSPKYVYLYEFESVKIMCNSMETPLWYYNNTGLPTHIEIGSSPHLNAYWILIKSAKISDSGSYECVGRFTETKYFFGYSEVQVIEVPGDPTLDYIY